MTGEELLKHQDERRERDFCELLRFHAGRGDGYSYIRPFRAAAGSAVLLGEDIAPGKFDVRASDRELARRLLARAQRIRSVHSELAVEFATELARAEKDWRECGA